MVWKGLFVLSDAISAPTSDTESRVVLGLRQIIQAKTALEHKVLLSVQCNSWLQLSLWILVNNPDIFALLNFPEIQKYLKRYIWKDTCVFCHISELQFL